MLSFTGGADYALWTAMILGLGGAAATVASSFIVQVGKARIQVDRERLALDKERAEVVDGHLKAKFDEISESLNVHRNLNDSLRSNVQELETKLNNAKQTLKDHQGKTSEQELRSSQLQQEIKTLREELEHVRSENSKMNLLLGATSRQTKINQDNITQMSVPSESKC